MKFKPILFSLMSLVLTLFCTSAYSYDTPPVNPDDDLYADLIVLDYSCVAMIPSVYAFEDKADAPVVHDFALPAAPVVSARAQWMVFSMVPLYGDDCRLITRSYVDKVRKAFSTNETAKVGAIFIVGDASYWMDEADIIDTSLGPCERILFIVYKDDYWLNDTDIVGYDPGENLCDDPSEQRVIYARDADQLLELAFSE